MKRAGHIPRRRTCRELVLKTLPTGPAGSQALATRIGRPVQDVKYILADLCARGWVERTARATYRFIPPPLRLPTPDVLRSKPPRPVKVVEDWTRQRRAPGPRRRQPPLVHGIDGHSDIDLCPIPVGDAPGCW